MDQHPDPSFSLILGAGGARGLAHIPVIEALDEMGLKPANISGASIGAVIGACYAAGMTGKDIRDFFLSLVARRTALATTLLTVRVGRFKDVKTFGNPLLLDGEKLLQRFWPEPVPHCFEDLSIPLTVVTTDFHARQERIYTSGALLPVIAASMAVPGAFQPVYYQNRILIDGGTINPLPLDALHNKARFTIAVDVTGGPQPDVIGQPSGFDIIFGALQLLQGSIITEKLRQCRPDILIRPPIDTFRMLDFFNAKKILEVSEPVKDELKRRIDLLLTNERAIPRAVCTAAASGSA